MEAILTFFQGVPFIDVIVYGFGVVLSFFFVIYSLILVGQMASLRKVVITDNGNLLYYLAIAQLVLAVVTFIVSLL